MKAREAQDTLDPRANLERIHYSSGAPLDPPSLALLRALHRAHLLAVPFENLSIHYGQPIHLEDAALYDKIVLRRRGGFCYELNGMFAWLLRRLDYRVTLLSARVAQHDGEFSPEFDHLTLLVSQVEGDDWLADVGFGDCFMRPLRFVAGLAQDGGDGYRYRVQPDAADGDWLLERDGGSEAGGWEPQYRFSLRPHVMSDFAERCIYQQTSPDSHFTQKRLCTLALPNGRVTLSDLRLITTRDGARDERMLASEDDYRAVLAERFGVTI